MISGDRWQAHFKSRIGWLMKSTMSTLASVVIHEAAQVGHSHVPGAAALKLDFDDRPGV